MTDEELLKRAVKFELVSPYVPGKSKVRPAIDRIRELTVERRTSLDDPNESWAILDGNFSLSHDGEWEYEPSPSSRDEKYLARCRWNSLREAIDFAVAHMEKYPSGNKP